METSISIDLKHQLKNTISIWVDRSFNFIQLSVLEKWTDNCLYENIRNPSFDEIFDEWIHDMDYEKIILEWCEKSNKDFNGFMDYMYHVDYPDRQFSVVHTFQTYFDSADWNDFKKFCYEEYEDDLSDYSIEQENYPLWNTCFEFRDSFFNNEDEIQTCLKIGLGVIQGLDSFNTILFMKSGGHSFYSAYWIPLYFELYPDEKEKYKDVDYSDL